MGGSSRGYITFLLVVQWSYLLLLPALLPPSPAGSLLPAYAAAQASSEQLAFSRAARHSAADAFRQLKADSQIAKALAAELGLPPQLYDDLTAKEQQQLARAAMAKTWAQLSADWSAHSQFKASISCPPSPDCSEFIHLDPATGAVRLDPGIQAGLAHRDFDLSITYPLQPGDLDS